jgi:hypothetical protein
MKSFASFFSPLVAPHVLALVLGLLVGCGEDEKPISSNAKLSEKYRRVGDNLGQTIGLLKSSATTPEAIAPADLGSVARVPKDVTGGVDIAVEQNGKSGEKAANIDATGSDETVTTFVPDVGTGTTTTAASRPTFVAWKGDADSDDVGLCYLAWTKGASWFVVSKCGDTSGAWVCQVTSAETTCNACSSAGECAPCDMEQSSFTCAWP